MVGHRSGSGCGSVRTPLGCRALIIVPAGRERSAQRTLR
jgi:hypothetical protein